MELNFEINKPIYIQIVEEIRKDIINEVYKEGEKIPSVRYLALELNVNPNTVQKALIILENEGLLITARTNGKYVTTNKDLIKSIKKEKANELTNEYLDNIINMGYTKEEIINLIMEDMEKWKYWK